MKDRELKKKQKQFVKLLKDKKIVEKYRREDGKTILVFKDGQKFICSGPLAEFDYAHLI